MSAVEDSGHQFGSSKKMATLAVASSTFVIESLGSSALSNPCYSHCILVVVVVVVAAAVAVAPAVTTTVAAGRGLRDQR